MKITTAAVLISIANAAPPESDETYDAESSTHYILNRFLDWMAKHSECQSTVH